MPVYGSDFSGRTGASDATTTAQQNTQTIADFQQFVTEFRENESFVYRDRLRANCLRKEWTLEVEMGHLIGWREDLASRCRNEPGEMVPLVRTLPLLLDSLVTRLTVLSRAVRDRVAQCRAESPLPYGGRRGGAARAAEGGPRNPVAVAEREQADAVP